MCAGQKYSTISVTAPILHVRLREKLESNDKLGLHLLLDLHPYLIIFCQRINNQIIIKKCLRYTAYSKFKLNKLRQV